MEFHAIEIIRLIYDQTWMAQRGENPDHGEVLIYLLNAAAAQEWTGSFETELLVTLCVPLVRK